MTGCDERVPQARDPKQRAESAPPSWFQSRTFLHGRGGGDAVRAQELWARRNPEAAKEKLGPGPPKRRRLDDESPASGGGQCRCVGAWARARCGEGGEADHSPCEGITTKDACCDYDEAGHHGCGWVASAVGKDENTCAPPPQDHPREPVWEQPNEERSHHNDENGEDDGPDDRPDDRPDEQDAPDAQQMRRDRYGSHCESAQHADVDQASLLARRTPLIIVGGAEWTKSPRWDAQALADRHGDVVLFEDGSGTELTLKEHLRSQQGRYAFSPSRFCRTLFQIERAALHSYGPEPHSR